MKFSDDGKQKNVFIAWTNSDLTEGRGHPVLIAVCETEATAARLTKNKGVMGSDGYTTVFPAIFHAGSWCAPFQMIAPTEQDKKSQIIADARAQAIRKARDAGLTDEDIRQLIGVKP